MRSSARNILELEAEFNTISASSTSIHKVSGSRHMGFAFPVKSEEEIKSHLDRLWKEYSDATHICYAWRLGADKKQFRSNDDGEPSGTAGKPILGQLQSFDVTNILVCVVRYFGGTKLGTGGLIDAYRTAARMALEEAKIIVVPVTQLIKIEFPFEAMGKVMKWMKDSSMEKINFETGDTCVLEVHVPVRELPDHVQYLKTLRGVNIEFPADSAH